jgi:prepilin-type N-terminal cleavage/methylation domain-containing protein
MSDPAAAVGERPPSDERGFTLVELVVVASVLLLVLGAILGVLESLTTPEHSTSTRIDDEQAVRLTLATLEHDVRAGRLVVRGSAPSDTTLDVILAPDVSTSTTMVSTSTTRVEWVFDVANSHTLTRYDQDGTVTNVLNGVTSGAFSYSDQTGQDSAWIWPDEAHCATIVQTSLAVASQPLATPQSLTVQDALRDQEPVGCSVPTTTTGS